MVLRMIPTMVKTVQISFDDHEHEEVCRIKGDLTWKQILYMGLKKLNSKLSKK